MAHLRIVGHMVTKNELDRYLKASLACLADLTGGDVHVYDDQSDDGTYEYLSTTGLSVERRPDGISPFAVNEGRFRAAAWRSMEEHLRPRSADWVLCLDADEFFVANASVNNRGALHAEIETRAHQGVNEIVHRIIEVFSFTDGIPNERVDGFWGSITGCRLVRWRPDGIFAPRRQGGGSVPTTWLRTGPYSRQSAILHLGYARDDDKISKQHRYSTQPGHNPSHVASILEPPVLRPWTGSIPWSEVSVAPR